MAVSFLQFKRHQKNNPQYLRITPVTGADQYLICIVSQRSVRFFRTTQKPRKGDLRELKSKTFPGRACPEPL